ncbi:unnamed protein product [Rotaria magnacalcarata]|uniref:Uncharacterized protein n=1 Tax=Rotaria magnacalcarata TaxID=392030 RepID=A0A8S3A9X5_9BILA|nr:unnamed protein product [Rotaria magnacalcarata]CAF4756698.1 unnamed protein product [Rotaria magnacalcarata]
MHIHFRFRDHIINSIIYHFDQVIKTIATVTTTTTTDPNSSLSPSKSDLVQSTKKIKSHAIKIYHQWTATLIKQYHDSLQVKCPRIPSVYNKILRIAFNNQHDQDLASEQLGIDIFDENHY